MAHYNSHKQEFLEKKNEITAQKIEAKQKIKSHKTSVGAWHRYAENLIIKASHIYDVFTQGDYKDKKALLFAIGENFILKNGKVTFDLRKPYSFIEAMNKSSSDLCIRRNVVDNVRTEIQRQKEYIYILNLDAV